MTVPQFAKTLRNLLVILDKGEAHADAKKFDVGVLLNSRLELLCALREFLCA